MTTARAFYRWSELNRTSYPALRDRVLSYEADHAKTPPRSYPGFPRWPLEAPGPRRLVALDRALVERRCTRPPGTDLPDRPTLGRLLRFAHGAFEGDGRGPVPSSGGLQSLELYLATFTGAWLPAGHYHFDRAGHHLSQLRAGTTRERWQEIVPGLELLQGGAILWVLAGDGARIEEKYGERGYRFLILEAGHLMQNLCLLSASLGLCTVPLGSFFEGEVAREFGLPDDDVVLYAGLCGPKP